MPDANCAHTAAYEVGRMGNGRVIYYCPDCGVTFGVGGGS